MRPRKSRPQHQIIEDLLLVSAQYFGLNPPGDLRLVVKSQDEEMAANDTPSVTSAIQLRPCA